MSDVFYARVATLMEAQVNDEIVGLDRSQGEVFGFNNVASDVWRLLEQPRTAGQVSESLQEKYDVKPDECASEVDALLKELIDMKLVKAIPAA